MDRRFHHIGSSAVLREAPGAIPGAYSLIFEGAQIPREEIMKLCRVVFLLLSIAPILASANGFSGTRSINIVHVGVNDE